MHANDANEEDDHDVMVECLMFHFIQQLFQVLTHATPVTPATACSKKKPATTYTACVTSYFPPFALLFIFIEQILGENNTYLSALFICICM